MFLYWGGRHCNILEAAVQNLVARSSGFFYHTTSKEFQAFSHYAKLPLVLRLFVPIGVPLRNRACWTRIWKNIRFILIYDKCFHSLRLYGDSVSVCSFLSPTIHRLVGAVNPHSNGTKCSRCHQRKLHLTTLFLQSGYKATFYLGNYLLLFTDGRSNTCFMPAAWLLWNFRFWAVSDIHGESNCVVSWSTRWVYLVRPLRPKFFTCITFGRMVLSKWSSSVAAEKSLLYRSSSSFCKQTNKT